MHFLATAEADYCLDALRGQLGNLRMGYAGQTDVWQGPGTSRGPRDSCLANCRAHWLAGHHPFPRWRALERLGLPCSVLETRFRAANPSLLKASCMASDGEWHKLAAMRESSVGCSLLSTSVTSMRDMDGALILNGAMGVKKLKELADGTVTQLQRFITNLVPMNSYLRRLRGDSGLLLLRWSARVDPAGGR